ncbi:MAG: YicC family protein [Bdellovibrionaceae bacterium]|nr:YicC family protein [Pseudobdellovibrionaceae bacterium]
MRSMTGYGTAKSQQKDLSIEVSIRSVNGRFLDTRFHLPREFIPFEADLKKILGEKILRGTVDIFVVRRNKSAQGAAEVRVNEVLAKKYLQAFQKISKSTKLSTPIHLEVLARMPEVIQLEERLEVSSHEEKLLKTVFAKACADCAQEREREGKFLQKELEKLVHDLEKQVRIISALREEANKQLQDRFELKVGTRMKGLEMDSNRLAQEIVIQLEKADINEELVRLAEHLKNYKDLLKSPQAEGKKLDFYTQELLREVNTIGSKSQVAKITQAVVEAKTLIERLREQVQNAE